MFSTVMSHALGLFGRVAPVLLALQDAPRPSGGAPASAPSQPAGGGGPAGSIMSVLPMLAIGVFMYFVMIRPMSKQRKEQEALQKGLQKGDKVVTNSGMVGTVAAVEDGFITLEIADRVRVKFLKDAVSRKLDATTTTATDKSAAGAVPADAKK